METRNNILIQNLRFLSFKHNLRKVKFLAKRVQDEVNSSIIKAPVDVSKINFRKFK